jgi:hypothetical protein
MAAVDGMPVVTTDFARFDAVPHQTTLHLVNNFVLLTTRFLYRFSNTCEEKLSEVSSGIQSLEISLSIIEAKLKIKGLEAAPAGAPAAAPAAAAAPTPQAAPSSAPPVAAVVPEPEPEPEPVEATGVKVKDHPSYKRFVKMLELGVPKQAVKNKMLSEAPDLNPDMIDDPQQIIAEGA